LTLATWRRGAAMLRFAVAGVLIMLAGCATAPQPIAGAGGAFARTGRFAISVSYAEGRQEAVQGGFAWLDDGVTYRLDLTNPLGSTEARVDGRPGTAVLTRANGSHLEAVDPDALVEDALGSPVPVGGLRDWLRGKVGSAESSGLRRDVQGRPETFEQDGWQASLSRYDTLGPRLLVLRREEPLRSISVRLVVDAPEQP